MGTKLPIDAQLSIEMILAAIPKPVLIIAVIGVVLFIIGKIKKLERMVMVGIIIAVAGFIATGGLAAYGIAGISGL